VSRRQAVRYGNRVLIFLLNLPLAHVVWLRWNSYIGMLLHTSANTIGAVLALVECFIR
jgi:hypothetical protein